MKDVQENVESPVRDDMLPMVFQDQDGDDKRYRHTQGPFALNSDPDLLRGIF